MNNVKIIVLAGSYDFGRCPIASRLQVSRWPVIQQTAINRIIGNLAAQGVTEVSVCSEDDAGYLKDWSSQVESVKINLIEEPYRVGTAGCLRDAAGNGSEEIIVVTPASIVRTPDIKNLINAHIEQKSDLTAVLNPLKSSHVGSAGIYICDRTVLSHIPRFGYCDIKEGLVPELVKQGRTLKTIELAKDIGNFRDGPGYLLSIHRFLETQPDYENESPSLRREEQNVWIDKSAEVDKSVKLLGPVVILADAKVAQDAVVFGPAVIGRKCRIGRNSFVTCSVLWDEAVIGPDCEVFNSLLDYRVSIADNTVIQDKIIPCETRDIVKQSDSHSLSRPVPCSNNRLPLTKPLNETLLPGASVTSLPFWVVCLAGVVISAVFLWSYWPGIADLWSIWMRSDEYSSGVLVPFLAGYVIWSRRDKLRTVSIKPALWGFAVLLLAEFLRLFGLFFMYGSATRLAVVVGLVAMVLILIGWEFFKNTYAVMLFLFLMLPWPNRVQAAMAQPLQHWATSSAVFCLETIGYDVFREGNIIHVGGSTIAVAEACNGLRMITAFFIISGLVVLLVKRNWWEKMFILASSLPIALFCNTMRLTITAIAFTWLEGDYWEKIFHDFGGYAMMPLALAIIVLEIRLIDRLTMRPAGAEDVIISARR